MLGRQLPCPWQVEGGLQLTMQKSLFMTIIHSLLLVKPTTSPWKTADTLAQSATIRIATSESTVLLPSLQAHCCQYSERSLHYGIQSAARVASVGLHSSLNWAENNVWREWRQSWKGRRDEAEIRNKSGGQEGEGKKTLSPSEVVKVKNTRTGGKGCIVLPFQPLQLRRLENCSGCRISYKREECLLQLRVQGFMKHSEFQDTHHSCWPEC